MPNPAASEPELRSDDTSEDDVPEQPGRSPIRAVNFGAVFDSAPDAYLVLAADPPRFTMVAANEARLRLTMTRRDEVVGRPLFEVFPDNPDDPDATGVRNLGASLDEVLRTGRPHRMAIQKYDIRTAEGEFEERYWEPLNSPVFDARGRLTHIIHRVDDVTDQVRNSAALAKESKARREIESILESITDGFFSVDQQWRFTYVNERAEEILKRRRDELIGVSLWEAFPDSLGTMFDREYHRAMTEQTTAEFVTCYEPLGIWVEVRAYPAPDALSVYFRDVTARKRAEEALRESEQRYRLLADMIPQNIWTTDAKGNHTYFSRRWYDFSRSTPDESYGEGWLKFIHPDDKERTLARWQHSLDTGEPYEIEYRFRGSDGEYRWFLGQAMPLRNDAGEIVQWFGTATDISERKELEAQREELLTRERQSRERVTTILESITDAFFAVDREWRFTYVNHEAERLMHRSREDLLGHTLWAEFSGAIGTAFEREYRRAMAEGVTVHFEDYSSLGIWVDVRAYPSEAGLSVFFRDVTKRKRAEEALRESERNFRALANSIPQLAWMADSNGWIFWYNDRWFEYTGTTLEEMEGWGWRKVHHPEHLERVVERIRRSFETGTPWEDVFPLRSGTGEYRWFLSRAVPIRDSNGKVVRWFGTNTDITDEKEAAAERERLLAREREARADADRRREELERVTESRTRLMRGFSHDVKNPLGAADGYAALLEEGIGGALSEKQCQSVQRIRRSIQMSLRLINDLLELARAEAGQIELSVEQINAGALVREIAEDFRGQITAAGLALEIDAPERLLVQSDLTRVRQILSNLVSNAAKYTRSGRITITADRRLGKDAPGPDEWVAISVADTGPGIPRDKQETIFQEFTRLDPKAPHGAGVGLAISRRIARLLGADVTVESEVGHGSRFTLWLPCT